MTPSMPLSAKAAPLYAAVLLALTSLNAQSATPVVPDAGSILQQVRPTTPAAPSNAGTGLRIEQSDGAAVPPSDPFAVSRIQIAGNTIFDTATLHALVVEAEGQRKTLPQLATLSARITAYYREHGFPLARAVIPAQTIRGGVVTIQVVEARYGKVGVRNTSAVSDGLLQSTLSPLQGGQFVSQRELDHTLLMISDIPGLERVATLRPGEAVGTSDLEVDITPGDSSVGNITLDNFGNRYTGRLRLGAAVDVANLLHHGDILSASGLTSGRGLNDARIGYDWLLNGLGTRVGASVSKLHYNLGGSLAALAGYGSAQVSSVWIKQTLLRGRQLNLYGQLQFERNRLRDHIDASAIQTDRHLDLWTASVNGDVRDASFAGAISTWNLGYGTGRVVFDANLAEISDAVTAKTAGHFSKWNGSLTRLQNLDANNALYFTLAGQWTLDNLDPSEKISIGGPNSVRAYDTGSISGDTGYTGTVEFRHNFGNWAGQWQGLVFVDTAHVMVNRKVWAEGTNSVTLNGAGLGLNWAATKNLSTQISVASRLGSVPGLLGSTAATRAWVSVRWGW